jgi:hypothetical protein
MPSALNFLSVEGILVSIVYRKSLLNDVGVERWIKVANFQKVSNLMLVLP